MGSETFSEFLIPPATRRELMKATEERIGAATRVITPNFEGPTVDNSGARIPNVRAALANGRRAKPSSTSLSASDFHKALETIRAAKPIAPWQQSMNEHHDHRVLNSNIEVKVAGGFPLDKTGRPLERPKNATFIRNTTATAA